MNTEKIVVEIRAGSGGRDAQLFASDLLRAYLLYAKKRAWGSTVLSIKKTDIGCREVVIEMGGKDIYRFMQQEGGTHQIQRVPPTERKGRVHSSTATVAVLPIPQNTDIQLSEDDLQIKAYKSSGPGGQHTQKNDTAIRIVHLPTGLSASSESERSQHTNKQKALSILRARLQFMEKKKASKKYNHLRVAQIGNALWSDRIRTYNMRHVRLVDHRTKYKTGSVAAFFEGNMHKLHEQGTA